MKRSSLSASVGYTDPGSTLGLTSTIDRNGLSTSAELTGVSIATNGPNGFQMDEINFAEQNINAAQDQTQDNQPNRDTTDADPTRTQEADNDFFRDMGEAGVAIAGLLAGGAGLVSGLFGGGAGSVTTGGNANPLPPNPGIVATDDPVRRREDEEGGEGDPNTEPNLDSKIQDVLDGNLQIIGELVSDDGNPYVRLSDGTLVSQNDYLAYTNRHSNGETILTGAQTGDRGDKPKPYPIDPSLPAKPVTVQQEVYSLSDSDKKVIAELKTKLSGLKVSDNEPEIVKTREAIAQKNKDFIENLSKAGKEIQDLKEQIDRTKKELEDLKKGNGLFTPSVDPTVLQMKLSSDLKKLESLNNDYNSIQGKYQDYNAIETKKEMDRARELALTRLQDSILENPFRQELLLNELALMGMEKGTEKYNDLKSKINSLKDNISEFDKAKKQLLNGSGEMQARAAEYILLLNPTVNVPRPTMTIESMTIANASAQPGYDPTNKQPGILPGINLPGATVTETEKGHSARPGKEKYFAVDIAAPYGSPYNPVAPGKATVHDSRSGYGKFVEVTHDYGVSTIYAHNSEFLIPSGTSVDVDPTTPIARVGNTGHTHSDTYPIGAPTYGGSHIHYEIHINGTKVPINSFDWERYKNEGQSYVNEVWENRPK